MIGAHLLRRALPRTVRAVPAPGTLSPKCLSAVWIIDSALGGGALLAADEEAERMASRVEHDADAPQIAIGRLP